MKPKLTRSQYDRKMKVETERLLREDKMLPLGEVLRAIGESRQKYLRAIQDVRKTR